MSAKRQKLPEEVRRAAILDAAHQLFRDNGYERTSMDQVAALAGLTKGGLYFHFKNKRALLEAIVRLKILGFQELVAEHQERPAADPRRRIEVFLEDLVSKVRRENFLEGKPEYLGSLELFLEGHRLEVLNREVRRCYRQMRDFLAQAVEEGCARGLFRVDPFTAALGFIALLEGMYLQYALDPAAFDPDQKGRQIIKMFLAGLVAPVFGEEA